MTTTGQRTDHQLRADIAQELAWTPNVTADRVGVAVSDGAVTLSGQVQTYPEKDEAVRAAFRVQEVVAVVDDLVVHSPWESPDDADIARAATAAFEHTSVVPAGSVHATVHDRVVTLGGEVTWQYQREAARDAVAALPGVTEVLNGIRVVPATTIAPASVAGAAITAAFERHARLDAEQVHVVVSGTTVALTGTVHSWAERREAEQAAWSSPGVVTVDNGLIVSP